jgi:hypothetical protein
MLQSVFPKPFFFGVESVTHVPVPLSCVPPHFVNPVLNHAPCILRSPGQLQAQQAQEPRLDFNFEFFITAQG